MELDTIILYRENWTWLPQWIRTCLEDLHYYSSERAFLKSMDSFPCSSDPFPPIRLCWSDHIPTSILSNHSGFGHICSQGRTTTWLILFTQPGNGLILKLCGRTMHNDGLLVTVVTTNITLGFFSSYTCTFDVNFSITVLSSRMNTRLESSGLDQWSTQCFRTLVIEYALIGTFTILTYKVRILNCLSYYCIV